VCRYFTSRTQWNSLHVKQIQPDARIQVQRNMSRCAFYGTAPGPPVQEKWCVDVSRPGRTRMHYMTHRSHWMQNHKFRVTCPDALFVEFVPVSSEPKRHVYVSQPGGTREHYVTRSSPWMQTHKFRVTCLCALFMETTPVPPKHEK
jgi:hypothetical protein